MIFNNQNDAEKKNGRFGYHSFAYERIKEPFSYVNKSDELFYRFIFYLLF